MIETERLRIVPLSVEQFFLLLAGTEKMEHALKLNPSGETLDKDTHAAMTELYHLSVQHYSDYKWYTNWQIILKKENKSIGSACFIKQGYPPAEAEIGYGIHAAYRNQGYMLEALYAMTVWAFANGIERLLAETEKLNIASQRVLSREGMQIYDETATTFRWELKKKDFYVSKRS